VIISFSKSTLPHALSQKVKDTDLDKYADITNPVPTFPSIFLPETSAVGLFRKHIVVT
jgi:hypothetical protein